MPGRTDALSGMLFLLIFRQAIYDKRCIIG